MTNLGSFCAPSLLPDNPPCQASIIIIPFCANLSIGCLQYHYNSKQYGDIKCGGKWEIEVDLSESSLSLKGSPCFGSPPDCGQNSPLQDFTLNLKGRVWESLQKRNCVDFQKWKAKSDFGRIRCSQNLHMETN